MELDDPPASRQGAARRARRVAQALDRIVMAGVALTARALSEATTESDLSLPQWRVLVVLADAKQTLRLSDIAARVGVTLPATSRQLRRLERRGLIEIRPDEHDRRAVNVLLTPAGERVRTTIVAHRLNAVREATNDIAVSEEGVTQLSVLADALDQFR